MRGGGEVFSFFQPGGQSFAMKSCLRGGYFDRKKLVAWVSVWGGW